MKPTTPESLLNNNNHSSLESEQFQKNWTSHFADVPPIAHTLKHHFAERWLRIHSLPNSKRYPTNATDWETLLERHNQVATHLLGDGVASYMVTELYDVSGSFNPFAQILPVCLQPFAWQPLPPLFLPDDGGAIDAAMVNSHDNPFTLQGIYFYPLFAAVEWHAHQFDNVLRAIAMEECKVFWVRFGQAKSYAGITNPVIFAPYDGGVDLIFANQHIRDNQKKIYRAWLSHREDGLYKSLTLLNGISQYNLSLKNALK